MFDIASPAIALSQDETVCCNRCGRNCGYYQNDHGWRLWSYEVTRATRAPSHNYTTVFRKRCRQNSGHFQCDHRLRLSGSAARCRCVHQVKTRLLFAANETVATIDAIMDDDYAVMKHAANEMLCVAVNTRTKGL